MWTVPRCYVCFRDIYGETPVLVKNLKAFAMKYYWAHCVQRGFESIYLCVHREAEERKWETKNKRKVVLGSLWTPLSVWLDDRDFVSDYACNKPRQTHQRKYVSARTEWEHWHVLSASRCRFLYSIITRNLKWQQYHSKTEKRSVRRSLFTVDHTRFRNVLELGQFVVETETIACSPNIFKNKRTKTRLKIFFVSRSALTN